MKDKIAPVALTLTALALLAALSAPQTHFETPGESQSAPSFTFQLANQPASLEGLRGKVVVMNFWATWCPPCVWEMPSLQRLHERMEDRGVVVLGINEDERPEVMTRFLRERNLSFPNYHDQGNLIANLYGTFRFPETYIIDKNGILVRKVIGPLEWDDPAVVAFLEELL